MHRQSTVDRPGELAAFVRAVDSGGFSAAARQLGLTPSAVSKVVSRLSPRGVLRLHSGTAMGLHQLTPVLPDFCGRYPEVDLELTVNERRIDLARLDIDEGADIVLRPGSVEGMGGDTLVIARTLCDLERVICAAPSYLERRGVPRTPDDLAQHNCLRLLEYADLSRWPFNSAGGVRTIEIRGQHAANNAETVLQMGLAGLGIIRLVGAHLASGHLIPVLADCHHVEPVPLHLLMPRDRHRLPKVTAMVDFLFEKFASAPWRQQATPAVRRRAARRPWIEGSA